MIEAETTLAAQPAEIERPPSRWAFWRNATFRRLMHHQLFVSGSILFAIVVVVAVFAPLITDADPNKLAMRLRFRAPDWDYPFGTDNLGRSQLSRVLYGARLSLGIGLGVVILNGVFGVLIGATSGYYRRLDDILMRISDALMALPPLL